MEIREYGVVLGRFQPLHLGHMEYLEEAKRRCNRLVIGITNPDTSALTFHSADPRRSQPHNNPFSYFVRHEMIDASLLEAGWAPASFAIVPADVSDVARVGVFLPTPTHTTVFITIYDEWGEEKARRLAELGYSIDILWRRDMSQRLTSGTELRQLIRDNKPWTHLVPSPVATHLQRIGYASARSDAAPSTC